MHKCPICSKKFLGAKRIYRDKQSYCPHCLGAIKIKFKNKIKVYSWALLGVSPNILLLLSTFFVNYDVLNKDLIAFSTIPFTIFCVLRAMKYVFWEADKPAGA